MALLAACTPPDDSSKPITAITAPASDASITATVPIQVDARDDQGISKVEVFARGRGSKAAGYSVGSAVSKPYVISWDSSGTPNGELELVAIAEDTAGNRGESTPVRVKVSNSNAPALNYLIAYNLPLKPPGFSAASVRALNGIASSGSLLDSGSAIPVHTQSLLAQVRPPSGQVSSQSRISSAALRPQAVDAPRTLALEWSWQAFQSVGSISGTDGYSVWLSRTDLAGPYARVSNIASSTAGTQKHSKDYPDVRVGDTVYGAIRAFTNNKTVESGYSNGDGAVFPRAQEAASPNDGASVVDGRPVLTWTPTPGVSGFLFFVYDKNPWDTSAKLIWGNSPKSTKELSVTYPADRAALSSGTYYWWVAGVTFDALEKADAFSFSEPRKFIVP